MIMAKFSAASLTTFTRDILNKRSITCSGTVVLDGQDTTFDCHSLGDDTKAAVNEHSQFRIASNSKLFCAVAVGMLVDDGKLKWETPVAEILPTFRLQDKVAEKSCTVRELLSHVVGLPVNRFEMQLSSSAEDILERTGHLLPNKGFREGFEYNNLMFAIASLVIEQLSGIDYRELVTQRIFDKLGMANTAFKSNPKLLVPECMHVKDGDGVKLAPVGDWKDTTGSLAAGGGIISTVSDMGKWLKHLLSLRDSDGLVKKETWRKITASRSFPDNQPPFFNTEPGLPVFEETGTPSYALALYKYQYKSVEVLTAWGYLAQGGSIVLMVPKENFAIAVFTNVGKQGFPLAAAVAYRALDIRFGFEYTDWDTRIEAALMYQPSPTVTLADVPPTFVAPKSGVYHCESAGRVQVYSKMANLPKDVLPKDAFDYTPAIAADPAFILVMPNQIMFTFVVFYAQFDGIFAGQKIRASASDRGRPATLIPAGLAWCRVEKGSDQKFELCEGSDRAPAAFNVFEFVYAEDA